MSSLGGGSALAELLGFAGVWIASWWNLTPKVHVDDASGEPASVGTSRHPIFWRIGAAASLVIFQMLLMSADASSRWIIPLFTTAVYALTRMTPSSSYTLLSPANWAAPKLDYREPLIVPAAGAFISLLLLWSASDSTNSIVSTLSMLLSGVAFFAVLPQSARDSEIPTEKTNADRGQTFLRSTTAYACGISNVWFIMSAVGMKNPFNVFFILDVAFRGLQSLGLLMFASENALAGTSTMTLSSIMVAILEDPHMIPGVGLILCFFGAVVQLLLTAPKSNDKRVALFAFVFLPNLFLPGIGHLSTLAAGSGQNVLDPLKSFPHTAFGQVHPIEKLHKAWTSKFEEKLAKQSKTIEEAYAEYKRRYHRQPPPGFDRWFRFAYDNNYAMVDEFDTLMQSLEPFWDVSPHDLVRRMKMINEYGGEFTELEVKKGKVERVSTDHWYAEAIKDWFAKFEHFKILGDFSFSINTFDEPRTSFDPLYMHNKELTPESIHANEDRLNVDKDNITWLDLGREPIWPDIRLSCPNRGVVEVDDESAYMSSFQGIDFLNAPPSAQDVCVSKSLRETHGMFLSPATMRLTHHVVPVFSQAAPRGYNDILYPTPFYYTTAEDDMKDNLDDVLWKEKRNQTYWAGRSTGGWASLENWKLIHRARVALMTSSKSTGPVTLLRRTKLGKWKPYQSWWGAIAEFFNIQVTTLVQCDDEACKDMEASFDLKLQPGNTSLQYKYILDIDGNSYTGRYYRLLRSSGCVIKSTIFREWHDDILAPWVHYIPLSNGAHEFGEMMRFLISEPEGDAIGQSIAQKGKEWANKSLRRQDMEVYALRVFMEYARLLDEKRDTNGFFIDSD